MHIVVDEDIPWALEAFSPFGDVTLRPGRALRREDLMEAEALVVRSVTSVGAELLEGTPVRFVGTATIGTDHLDLRWLEGAGIRWTSAKGSNARSVVEWVLAGLAEWCVSRNTAWDKLTLGIVGCGTIGSKLARVAKRLGIRVLVNDPPLEARRALPPQHARDAIPLEALLEQSDFVSLHVPLERVGQWPTWHLIGKDELRRMKPGAVLANSSRGPVLDNQVALRSASGGLVTLVLDVFENEPAPDRELVRQCFLATPHVAGYSLDGKMNGTRMIAEALGEYTGRKVPWKVQLAPPEETVVRLPDASPVQQIHAALRHAYPIREDDERLRGGLALESDADWAAHFDRLRREYPVRRETNNYALAAPSGDDTVDRWLVDVLGMKPNWHDASIGL